MIVPTRYSLLLGVLLLSTAGCKTTFTTLAEKIPFTPQYNAAKVRSEQPVRMALIWTEALLSLPGKPTTRGFGGRIYFYNQDNKPVTVTGEFVVNAFDDTIEAEGTGQPKRKYVYTTKQFSRHYSKTRIGDSYSIWLPWDAAGGQRREISLLPIFKPEAGSVIVGNQSRNILPGKKRLAANKRFAGHAWTNRRSSDLRRVAYDFASRAERDNFAPGDKPRSGASSLASRTTTITLPRNLSRSMAAATAQQFWSNKTTHQRNADRTPVHQRTANRSIRQGSVHQLPPQLARTPSTIAAKQPATSGRTFNAAREATTFPAARRQDRPSTRFSRPRPRARREPIGRLTGVDARWQPRPEARPSSLPFSRQSYQSAPPKAESW